jgi:hypothetical protein
VALKEQSSAMTRIARILTQLSPSDRGPVFRWVGSLSDDHFVQEEKVAAQQAQALDVPAGSDADDIPLWEDQ